MAHSGSEIAAAQRNWRGFRRWKRLPRPNPLLISAPRNLRAVGFRPLSRPLKPACRSSAMPIRPGRAPPLLPLHAHNVRNTRNCRRPRPFVRAPHLRCPLPPAFRPPFVHPSEPSSPLAARWIPAPPPSGFPLAIPRPLSAEESILLRPSTLVEPAPDLKPALGFGHGH